MDPQSLSTQSLPFGNQHSEIADQVRNDVILKTEV